MPGVKKYSGGWVDYCDNNKILKYSGGWNTAKPTIWKYSGGWVQLYPATNVVVPETTYSIGGACWHYKSGNKTFEDGIVKQGYYGGTQYSLMQYGYTGFNHTKTGKSGSIVDVSKFTFKGKRETSGAYGNKSMEFWSSPTSGKTAPVMSTKVATYTGDLKSPGASFGAYSVTIANKSQFINMLNGTNGYLFIYKNETGNPYSANYMAYSAPVYTLAYTYNASKSVLTYASNMSARSKAIGSENTIEMYLYDDEIGMTPEEIFTRREKEGIADIDPNMIQTVGENGYYRPVIYTGYRFVEETSIFEIDINNVREEHNVEYSYDNITFKSMLCKNENTYISYIPKDTNTVYVRVVDTIRDILDLEDTFNK